MDWKQLQRLQGGIKMLCAKVDKIITAMAESCLSPQEIADKAHVSINVVYRMRRGYLVKLQSFGLICKALGIKPEEVIDYERLNGKP